MVPIAVRDYLRFGVLQSLSLFKAMTRYPTLERLPNLVVPTLVIVGERDPLVRIDRAHVLAVLPHVDVVVVPGAHALNYSAPELIAELIEAHLADAPLATPTGPRRVVKTVDVGAQLMSRAAFLIMDDEHTEHTAHRGSSGAADLRPSWRQVAWRSLLVTVTTAIALWVLAAILEGFTIDRPVDALLAGFVVGVANAVVWPALAFLIVPLSVLTLGLGAIVLNALFVTWVLELLPGVDVDGFWTSLADRHRAGRRRPPDSRRCSRSTTTPGSTDGRHARPASARAAPP